jgi:hypothetical protein
MGIVVRPSVTLFMYLVTVNRASCEKNASFMFYYFFSALNLPFDIFPPLCSVVYTTLLIQDFFTELRSAYS